VAASALMLENEQCPRVDAPGPCHQDVDPPVYRICLLDKAKDWSSIGDVKLMGRGRTTRIDDLGHCRFGFPPRQRPTGRRPTLAGKWKLGSIW